MIKLRAHSVKQRSIGKLHCSRDEETMGPTRETETSFSATACGSANCYRKPPLRSSNPSKIKSKSVRDPEDLSPNILTATDTQDRNPPLAPRTPPCKETM